MNLIAVQFALLILGVACVLMGYHVLREYECASTFRWGRLARGRIEDNGSGVVIIIPFIDTMVRVSVRTVTIDVAPQDVITKNNIIVYKCEAVIYVRVLDQERAIARQAEAERDRLAKVKSPALLGGALELGGFLFLR